MSCEHPFITGTGLVTPLGSSVEETWRALLAGEFIRDHAPSSLVSSAMPSRDTGFQSVPENVQAVIDSNCALARESRCRGRIGLLARRAADEAIASAGWGHDLLSDSQTALVIGTSKGPVENWVPTAGEVSGNASVVKVDSNCYGLATLAETVAHHVGLGRGPRATLSAACASGIHALIHASLLLRSRVARRALVVAAEASVHPLFIGSFKRLGVLPREGVGCRPFDEQRDGFLISEAAAAVCIEADETPRAIARIDRYAMGGDASHLTGSDPAGRTLRYLLKSVIDQRPVDLVHAHATGTVFNDPIELAAIEMSLESQSQAANVYSHKGALGHSLGAAGLVSVVLNCRSHQTGLIPPNVRTTRPIPIHGPVLISEGSIRRPIHRSVALAAGFGGAVGVLSLVSE